MEDLPVQAALLQSLQSLGQQQQRRRQQQQQGGAAAAAEPLAAVWYQRAAEAAAGSAGASGSGSGSGEPAGPAPAGRQRPQLQALGALLARGATWDQSWPGVLPGGGGAGWPPPGDALELFAGGPARRCAALLDYKSHLGSGLRVSASAPAAAIQVRRLSSACCCPLLPPAAPCSCSCAPARPHPAPHLAPCRRPSRRPRCAARW